MSRLLDSAAVARWIRPPAVPRRSGPDCHAQPLDLSGLPSPSFSHGRNRLRGPAQAASAVVPRDVVGDRAEERGQRAHAANGPRARVISDGSDLAAQAATGNGTSGAQAAVGHGRGRHTLGKEVLVAVAVEENAAGMGTGPATGECRRLGSERRSLRARCCGAGRQDPNGRLAELYAAARAGFPTREGGHGRGHGPARAGHPASAPNGRSPKALAAEDTVGE